MESHDNLLETLTEQQQSQVFDLMTIGNIEDINVAAKLFIDSNYDMNRAVQKWLDRQSGVNHENDIQTSFPTHEQHVPVRQNSAQRPRSNETELHKQYRQHLEKKAREEEEKGVSKTIKQGVGTVMTGIKNFWNSYVPVNIRGETIGGEQFQAYFKKYFPNFAKQLKFNMGTFEENAWKADDLKIPFLVYVHVDDASFRSLPNKIFNDKAVIDHLNGKFHLLGLIANTEEAQKITKYIEPENFPCFGVFRTNLLDETVLLESMTLTLELNAKDILDHLKNIEGNYHMIRSEEVKIKQDVQKSIAEQRLRNMQMSSPFWYAHQQNDEPEGGQMFPFFAVGQIPQNFQLPQQRPQISPEEQARLEEARILRQIQEEEYKEVERKIMEQQKQQTDEEKNKKEREEQLKMQSQQKEEEKRQIEEKREQMKKLKLESIPPEPEEGAIDAILIVFRLPDGSRIERRFRNTDKVQTLYDYADTQELQFDSTTVKYDLMQPRPFLCLEDKEKTIGEYFEGSNSEVIHIRELNA